MSDPSTSRFDARPVTRAQALHASRWKRRALLAAMLTAFSALACAQNVNPDETGHEPVSTREALHNAKPVTAKHAMVVSAQHLATMVGVDILKRGGNAVDAAVAVGFAEAVVHPCCGNIGGGGFMTIHLKDGRNLFLNFREKAPSKATPTMFQDANGNVVEGRSTDSYLGVGVPGTVMGFATALKAYGTMSLQQLIAPAINGSGCGVDSGSFS